MKRPQPGQITYEGHGNETGNDARLGCGAMFSGLVADWLAKTVAEITKRRGTRTQNMAKTPSRRAPLSAGKQNGKILFAEPWR